MTLLPSKIDGYELSEVSQRTDLYSCQHSHHDTAEYIHFCCAYIGPTNIHLYAPWPSYEAYQPIVYTDEAHLNTTVCHLV